MTVVEFVPDAQPTAGDRKRWRIAQRVCASGIFEHADLLSQVNARLQSKGLPEFLSLADVTSALKAAELDNAAQRKVAATVKAAFETLKPVPDPEREKRMALFAKALVGTGDDRALFEQYNGLLRAAGLQSVRREDFETERYMYERHISTRKAPDAPRGKVREFHADAH